MSGVRQTTDGACSVGQDRGLGAQLALQRVFSRRLCADPRQSDGQRRGGSRVEKATLKPRVGGVQVKVEDTDGSYDCAICFESVRRSADALRCSQCSSNPFHGACLLQSGFADTCPQCCGSALVAGVRATGGDAARIDLADGDLDLSAAATKLNTSTADAMDAIVRDLERPKTSFGTPKSKKTPASSRTLATFRKHENCMLKGGDREVIMCTVVGVWPLGLMWCAATV